MEIRSRGEFLEGDGRCELTVSHSGFVITDETWKQEPLYAPYSRLYYVMGGSGVLYSESEEMHMEGGYAYLAPCGMKYGFYGTDSVSKLFFHVQLPISPDGRDAFAQANHFVRLPRDPLLLRRLTDAYFSESAHGDILIKAELYRTVSEALEQLRRGKDSLAYSKPVSDAVTYIREHLTAGLTVGEIAEAVFCSQSKLSGLFRREVGQSVARYIDDLLMSEAQTMLLYSDRSVREISEALGFCDQFYFSRRFTERFSVSPSQFRKKRI